MKNMSFEEILVSVEKIGERVIPGLKILDNQKVMYFEDDGVNQISKQFNNLTNFEISTNIKSGGIILDGCVITTPNSIKYHALLFHGDLEGWTEALLARVKVLNISLASIQDEKFVTDKDESYLLSECEIEFY